MTDVPPSAEERARAFQAQPALWAQSNILGPYILMLTAVALWFVHAPDWMVSGAWCAGLLAWKANAT